MPANVCSNQRKADPPQPTIRASEIGEYSYCSRAWWYRHVAQIDPPRGEYTGRLVAGTQAHARHGQTVVLARYLRLAALLLVLGAVLIMLAAALLSAK